MVVLRLDKNMFQKNKMISVFLRNFLKKISRKNVLIFFLVFTGLFVAVETTNAWVFDLAKSAMAGLADIGGTIFAIFASFLMALLVSHWLVYLSAHLLEWAMALPVNLMDNALVITGWTFIRDLVNLFFALALVAIAMAFILKIESFEIKKSLPRLIIIALLVNFSLLLVGAFIDVATILQNTILGPEGIRGLVINTVGPLVSAWTAIRDALLGVIGAWAIALAIPYVDVTKVVLQAILLGLFFNNFFHWIFIILINTLLGLILFFFFFLFLIRIIALWILAIFAPLAFVAFILPITNKYFHLWLKAVVSWAFLGVIAFFLLALGLNLIHEVAPKELAPGILDWPWEISVSFVIYNLFLLVFLIVAFVVSLKMAPTGADMAINTVKSAVGGIAKTGIGTALGHKLAGIEGRAGKALGDVGEKGIEHGEGLKKGGGGWMSRIRGGFEQALGRPLARMGYGMQEHAQKQGAEEHKGLVEKYKDYSTDALMHAIENTTDKKVLAALSSIAARDPGHAAGLNQIIKDKNESKAFKESKSEAEWGSMKQKDREEHEQKIAKGSLIEERMHQGYLENKKPENVYSGDSKKMENAFAATLAAKGEKIDVEKISNRAQADPDAASKMDIPGMLASKELGEATREQILNLPASALRSFEKTPMILNDLLTGINKIIALPIEQGGFGGNISDFTAACPELADYIKGTPGCVLRGRRGHRRRRRRP